MEILGTQAPDPAGLGPATAGPQAAPAPPAVDPWTDAALVAALIAVDPAGLGGVALKALPGPARDAWLAQVRALLPAAAPLRRVPLHVTDERLLGGLDLAATLHAGRPVAERGLLVEADGGVIVLAMAERVGTAAAAKLGMAIDHGAVRVERDGIASVTPTRFGVVALDESVGPDEGPPEALLDRLAFHMELEGLRQRDIGEALHDADEIVAARALLDRVTIEDQAMEALCGAAIAMGVPSLRAPLFALRVARAAAALDRRTAVEQDDLTLAARLVLAPRATRMPPPPPPPEQPPEDEEEEEPPPPDDGEDERDQQDDEDKPLEDRIVDAAQAAIPANLLARLMAAAERKRRQGILGRSGEQRKALTRGRPIGSRRGDPRAGARLALIETLRAAAPWQPLRRAEVQLWEDSGRAPPRVLVRKDDFRITRFKKRSQATIIFAVDASGSAAIARLGEAKGAVELLLADCYARRDQVALIAFRGKGAETLLPPTRSLARAKKRLAGFPGGGGTPLASGIEAAHLMAEVARTRGETPSIVILTDGRANVTLEGIGGRARAEEQAKAAAEGLRVIGVSTLLVDMSLRPAPKAEALAQAMGATYMPLPRADARALSTAARSAAQTAE
ncbi:magnesium chelatase subunit D [Roseospira goensis]|uniref:Mg-protoporphyrin IX chelatase n=1 Tax=Roseospira goensis TaxID=391922 RepID=A0A7W6S2E1_9PROT|nr:magnesium chelatase subunit D [Roseospira goensis]MBB4287618.1 magnesium chelatase subunit D [Roseospira goensis]